MVSDLHPTYARYRQLRQELGLEPDGGVTIQTWSFMDVSTQRNAIGYMEYQLKLAPRAADVPDSEIAPW